MADHSAELVEVDPSSTDVVHANLRHRAILVSGHNS